VTIFEIAEEAVSGDRHDDYGHPRHNHERTAILWNAYMDAKAVGTAWPLDITPEDVCWLNVLQKIARQMNSKKEDNLVDAVGYIRNIEMMEMP
jgi:hypothetical protein